jgi:hypothetical protein
MTKVHAALWAIGVAFVLYVAVFVVFKLPKARAQAELLRSEQMNAEHEWYCRRWHMDPRTPMHNQCVADLVEFRTSIENRVAEDNSF